MIEKDLNTAIKQTGVIENKSLQTRAPSFEIKSFKDEFEQLLDGVQIPLVSSTVPLFDEIYTIDTDSIENVDAMFFLNISSQGESLNIQMNDETSVIDASSYKTMPVSKTLGDILMKAAEGNKSVRLDFDEHVTVILKVASDGRIDASFIPQNKEVEKYLRNNIDYLKVRFDEQNIAYSNISYKPYRERRQNQRQNNQGDKNE